MTLLRGHFAMVMVCSGEVPAARMEEELAFLTADGSLAVTVREVPEEAPPPAVASTYTLTVHGADRPGIVGSIAGRLAAAGGNITDLGTRLAGSLYVLTAEVDLPAGADVEQLQESLGQAADELGVDAALRPVDSDEL